MTTPAGIDLSRQFTENELPVQLIEDSYSQYKKPEGIKFAYGTAGVRTK